MNVKALVILLLGITITTTVIAAEKPTASHQTVINVFMDSYINSDHKKLREVLSDDVEFVSNRDVRVIKHSAESVLKQMKTDAGVKQADCAISAKIISETNALVVACVDINYEQTNATQQNFVIIERNKDGEWKIAKVYKLFLMETAGEKRVV
ncbi:hypothetical protein [Pedobacter sp. MW01-1-1]|uniref:hypothetical protein n=1 Tax=Pedobacter sp. MW01-1-1 TaxID=3383027 RepID=UPI003FF0FBC9